MIVLNGVALNGGLTAAPGKLKKQPDDGAGFAECEPTQPSQKPRMGPVGGDGGEGGEGVGGDGGAGGEGLGDGAGAGALGQSESDWHARTLR